MPDFQLDLDSETVEQAHPVQPVCVEPALPVRQVLQKMKEGKRGAVLVCLHGTLVGIFTERDALRLMADAADFDAPVERYMSRKLVTVSARDSVGTAISRMAVGGHRRLPVVDSQGRPTGLIKVSGILRYLVDHFPNLVYTLPPTPHHNTQEREGA